MRSARIDSAVMLLMLAASCEHAEQSWREGDWLVDLMGNCDGEGDSLEKQKCAPEGCVEGDFGAECVLTTAEECAPEAYYCKGNSLARCGRSGHPQSETDCTERAQWRSGYWDNSGPSCVEGFGTAECVHAGLSCDPDRYHDCVGDYLVQCGSTGFALDFKICSYQTPTMRCVIQDRDARCQK